MHFVYFGVCDKHAFLRIVKSLLIHLIRCCHMLNSELTEPVGIRHTGAAIIVVAFQLGSAEILTGLAKTLETVGNGDNRSQQIGQVQECIGNSSSELGFRSTSNSGLLIFRQSMQCILFNKWPLDRLEERQRKVRSPRYNRTVICLVSRVCVCISRLWLRGAQHARRYVNDR